MKGPFLAVTLLGFLCQVYGTRVDCDSQHSVKSVYDFNATNIYQNETISFSKYRGSVLAIVNVVSKHASCFLSLLLLKFIQSSRSMSTYLSKCECVCMRLTRTIALTHLSCYVHRHTSCKPFHTFVVVLVCLRFV